MKATYEKIVNYDNIKLAIENMAKNKGSNTAGIDGKTKTDYPDTDKLNLEIQKRLKKYHPQPVKRVFIPKPNSNEVRPLGIPCYIDRVIQMAIKQIIEPICEDKFYKKSYGFRYRRRAEHAIADIHKIVTLSRNYHVASVDIKGFFDNVNHEILYQQLVKIGITCTRTLALIRAILKAPISEDGKLFRPNKGTPQGGVISPLLSNVVLNDIDWLVDKQWLGRQYKTMNKVTGKLSAKVRANNDVKLQKMRQDGIPSKWIVRYADDFVLLSDQETGIRELKNLVVRKLNKLGLEVSEEKTKIVDLRASSIDFLGFKIFTKYNGQAKNTRGETIGSYVMVSTLSDKAESKAYRNIKKAWKTFNKQPTKENYNLLNSVIAGTQNYYCIATRVSGVTANWQHRLWDTMRRSTNLKLKYDKFPKYVKQKYPTYKGGLFWSKYGVILPIYITFRKPYVYKKIK
ncbi:group II intron reverse transcriptase/maturase [Psychrobacter sp. 1U2]|uniref:group II intron reverse transcriptase/maturase n=1 Tax=Psychrobacter sp. 1U2 TaxID=3453577 RepID=UPI003F47296C